MANKKFGLNVSLENLTPKDATIVIECSDETVRAFKKLFRDGGMIRYEYGNVVDTEGQD